MKAEYKMTEEDFDEIMDSVENTGTVDEAETILKKYKDYIYYELNYGYTQHYAGHSYDTYTLYAYLIDNDDISYTTELTYSEVE